MRNTRKFIIFSLVALLCMSLIPFSLAVDNTAPIAENLEIKTYRGVSVGGQLSAVDPEGDLLTFEITTGPTKGKVELKSDGHFVYTPKEGKKGRDYFGFRAVDANGNQSQEATVLIKIEKQKSNVCYADMAGSPYEYAAVFLSETGIYTGSCTGGQYIFNPSDTVTRGEFLAMCMQLRGEDILTGVRTTGFADDSTIPAWIKPYVSTALMTGAVSGYSDNTGATFQANEPVGYYEAVVMLNNILGTSNAVTTGSFFSGAEPDWAAQAVANLSAYKILEAPGSAISESLTRSQAASMLVSAYDIVK